MRVRWLRFSVLWLKKWGLASLLSILPWLGFSQPADWSKILAEAAHQEVYFHAWGGSPTVNRYIQDAAQRLEKAYQVKLIHVKVQNIAESIALLQTEKNTGKQAGKIDLLWVNGANFFTLKNHQLLYGPFVQRLPNAVKIEQNSVLDRDFGIATDGLEAPWGRSSFVFIYDPKVLPNPPKSAKQFLAAAKANRGKLTYPMPPDFTGITFLKQMLYELITDRKALMQEVDPQTYPQLTKAFWAWLDELTPYLWQAGKNYPKSPIDQRNKMQEGIVAINFSFAPLSTASDIEQKELRPDIRTYLPTLGTIQNTHYLAIPFNARQTSAALVAINHFLSEQEQYEKLIPKNWGDLPVLALDQLSPTWAQKFSSLPLGAATLPLAKLRPVLPEPHPSWVKVLEEGWKERYIR